jgi:hypothetical protein
MMERARDLPLAQIRAIVAFDQERNATGVVGAARPRQRAIQRIEFLVEKSVLVERRDRLGSARAAICTICHGKAVHSTKPPNSKRN